MNVLVGYMLLWVLFESVMLAAGDQIFHRKYSGLWYLRFDGTWPELGQVRSYCCCCCCCYCCVQVCMYTCAS